MGGEELRVSACGQPFFPLSSAIRKERKRVVAKTELGL